MIKIEILRSLNKDLLGEHIFYKNILSLGPTKSDVLIKNKETYKLSIIDSKVKFENDKKSYLLNGKKALSARNLNPNDTIMLEDLEFKVLDFKVESSKTDKEIFTERFDAIVEENGIKLETIKKIKEGIHNE